MRPLEARGNFLDFTWDRVRWTLKKKKKSHKYEVYSSGFLTMMTLIVISSFNDWALFSFIIWRKDTLLKSEQLGYFLFVVSTTAADRDFFLNLNEQLSPAIWIPSLLYLSNNSKDCYYCQFEAFNKLSKSSKFNHMKQSAVLATFFRISISHYGNDCTAFLWGIFCFY